MFKIIIKKSVYLALLACLPALQVQAEIYKCVNKQGKTFYNDKACPIYDKETKIKAVKDPKNGYIPPIFVKDKEGKGKTIVIGRDASKEFKKSIDDKDAPKDEHSSPLNGEGSKVAGSAPYAAPVSDSGRVPSSSAKNNISEGGSKKPSDIAVLPRVELKVEHREY